MTPTNAKTAALEALIEAHAIDLKLPTVRRRFRALAEEATREQQTRSPTSARCLRPRWPNAPSVASAAACSTRGSPRSNAWRTIASPTTPRSRRPRSPPSPKEPGSTTATA